MAEDFEVTGGLPEDDENRTFVIAAAGLGGLIVLSLICLGVYALILQPRQRQAAIERPTEIVLTNTAVALGLTQTEEAEDFTPVPTLAPPTFTSSPEPTDTEVPTQVVVLPTDTPTPTPFTTLPTLEPLTATAAAQLTATAEAIAGGAASPTPTPSATALPTTGFADDVGLPGLAALAALFLGAIFLSRRLRSGPTVAN